ncbi:MAG: hypothetical protein V5A15_01405 [Haloarcula sp.]
MWEDATARDAAAAESDAQSSVLSSAERPCAISISLPLLSVHTVRFEGAADSLLDDDEVSRLYLGG